LEKTLNSRLKHLSDEDRKALGVMLDAAANKLLHAPTRALKGSTQSSDGDLIVAAVRRLFDLPEPTEPAPDEKDATEPRH
jgi:glutamyl-tRNA reductase